MNPVDETITVLILTDDAYTEHDMFHRGQQATSILLNGFVLNVSEVFDAV